MQVYYLIQSQGGSTVKELGGGGPLAWISSIIKFINTTNTIIFTTSSTYIYIASFLKNVIINGDQIN